MRRRARAVAAVLVAVCAAPACGTRLEPVDGSPAAPPGLSTPTPVRVPGLVGLRRVEAVRRSLELGLHVEVVALGRPRGKPPDRVARQIPLPGTPLAPGARVVVAAWCLPAPCPSPPRGRTIYDPCSCATRG